MRRGAVHRVVGCSWCGGGLCVFPYYASPAPDSFPFVTNPSQGVPGCAIVLVSATSKSNGLGRAISMATALRALAPTRILAHSDGPLWRGADTSGIPVEPFRHIHDLQRSLSHWAGRAAQRTGNRPLQTLPQPQGQPAPRTDLRVVLAERPPPARRLSTRPPPLVPPHDQRPAVGQILHPLHRAGMHPRTEHPTVRARLLPGHPWRASEIPDTGSN